MKFLGVTISQGVEFSIFLLILNGPYNKGALLRCLWFTVPITYLLLLAMMWRCVTVACDIIIIIINYLLGKQIQICSRGWNITGTTRYCEVTRKTWLTLRWSRWEEGLNNKKNNRFTTELSTVRSMRIYNRQHQQQSIWHSKLLTILLTAHITAVYQTHRVPSRDAESFLWDSDSDSGLKSDADSWTCVIVTVYWVNDADSQILKICNKNNNLIITK